MGLFSKLFKGAAVEPVQVWSHPVLGQTVWSAESEAWCGQVGTIPFSISYEDNKTGEPDPELVDYAVLIFSDVSITNDGFVQARSKAVSNYGEHYRDEIEALTIGSIDFLLDDGECGMIAQMDGGQMNREWESAFLGKFCESMSFDA